MKKIQSGTRSQDLTLLFTSSLHLVHDNQPLIRTHIAGYTRPSTIDNSLC